MENQELQEHEAAYGAGWPLADLIHLLTREGTHTPDDHQRAICIHDKYKAMNRFERGEDALIELVVDAGKREDYKAAFELLSEWCYLRTIREIRLDHLRGVASKAMERLDSEASGYSAPYIANPADNPWHTQEPIKP